MRTIIATIKPQHLAKIRGGKKLLEMRKSCPKERPFRVLCCQSGSGGQILAEFEVHTPIKAYPAEHPELVWQTCVSAREAEQYAAGKELWFWEIRHMIDYCTTKGYRVRNVSEFGLKRAPQSWQYVEVPDV